MKKVQVVPTSGMNTSTGRKVPTKSPGWRWHRCARRRARLLRVADRQADRKWRDRAQQGDRDAEQDQHRGERAEQDPHLELVEGIGCQAQHRASDQRHQPGEKCPPGEDADTASAGKASGQPSARR